MTIGGLQDSVKYTLTGPDGTVATFNDPTDANYIGFAKFTGLDDADVRETAVDRVEADGQTQLQNWLSGRPITINLEIVPTSTTDFNTKWDRLQKACNALREDAQLVWTPDGSAQMGLRLRKNGPIRKSDDSVGMLRKVQVPLKAADPYKYSTTLHTQALSGATIISNAGSAPSPPEIDLVAPSGTTSFALFNQTTGEAVQIANFVASNYFMSWLRSVGSGGIIGGQFTNAPYDVAYDAAGNVWATDNGNHRIQKFNSSGVFQSAYGVYGTGTPAVGGVPQFNQPNGLAFDSSGNLWVTDSGNNRVQKLNSSGQWQASYGSLGSGTPAVGGVPQWNRPSGIAIDTNVPNNIFVSDTHNNRVQKLNSSGQWQAAATTGATALSQPWAIAVDSANKVYVGDGDPGLSSFYRVERFTNALAYDGLSFGSVGNGDGQFNAPYGIAIDSTYIYVSDSTRRVQKFNAIGGWVSKVNSAGLGGMAFNTAKTRLAVADSTNNQFQEFVVSNTPTITVDLSVPSAAVAGTSIFQYIDLASTSWWKLQPGNNSILVTGASSASISWRDAWL